MAKNTHAQEAATGTSGSYTEAELNDPEPQQPIVITRPILGEVDRAVITEAYSSQADRDEEEGALLSRVVDGGDSTQSSQSEPKSDDRLNQYPPQHAPMTESPSSPIRTEVSGVDSTDGDGLKTEPQQSVSGRKTPAKKAAVPKKATGARSTMMGAEDDDF